MNVIARLAALDTCAVSDALDNLGLPGATVGLRPLWSFPGVAVGRARTVLAGARSPDSPQTHIASPLVATCEPGDVVVIANDGRTDVSCWGGILAVGAKAKGVAAVIVDGACRDIVECEQLELPVCGRAVVPVSARSRIVQIDMDVPIRVADVAVRRGDLVIADSCGVVFVPEEQAEAVIAEAEAIHAREAKMLDEVRAGVSLVGMMQDSNFVGRDS
jgi:regulator of RNase E activity RraA